jgi:PIN domain nuclease of toxin-antitoxin system
VKLLLDTHVLFWFDTEPGRLSQLALDSILNRNNLVYVSAINAWELTIKFRLGRLPNAKKLLDDFRGSMSNYGFLELPFTSAHAIAEKDLTVPHGDPFDRALAAQAAIEKLNLVTGDEFFAKLPNVQVLW